MVYLKQPFAAQNRQIAAECFGCHAKIKAMFLLAHGQVVQRLLRWC